MFGFARLRGWPHRSPPIRAHACKRTQDGLEVALLIVRKQTRARTVTLTLHPDEHNPPQKIKVKWDNTPVGEYQGSVLEYA